MGENLIEGNLAYCWLISWCFLQYERHDWSELIAGLLLLPGIYVVIFFWKLEEISLGSPSLAKGYNITHTEYFSCPIIVTTSCAEK